MDHIDWFLHVEWSLYLGDEAFLTMMDDLFEMFLDLVCEYFIEYFSIYIHKCNGFVIIFLCRIFVWFGYQSDCGLIK